jgi:hypothetical protein
MLLEAQSRFRSQSVARKEAVVRCFFMKHGHITAVELLPGLNDEEAVKKVSRVVRRPERQSGI